MLARTYVNLHQNMNVGEFQSAYIVVESGRGQAVVFCDGRHSK